MTGEQRLTRARAQSNEARSRLTGTLVEIQNRLRPGALLDVAVEDLSKRADDLARDAVDMVKARPVATAGLVLAVIVYLFRGPLLDALGAMFEKATGTDDRELETEDQAGPPA